jgi:hypothetical protein
VILPYEQDEVFGQVVRHFEQIDDAPKGFVVTAQKVDLVRQIMLVLFRNTRWAVDGCLYRKGMDKSSISGTPRVSTRDQFNLM